MQKSYDMLEWGEYLKHVNRYQLTESQEGFINTVISYLSSTPYILESPHSLYRSRKHGINQQKAYALPEMGAPPAFLQKGGRCNPPGIPCLYLASSSETAISEVRPWKGALISVAKFELNSNVRLADLRSIAHRPNFLRSTQKPRDKSHYAAIIEKIALYMCLESSFARPGQENTDIDYVPTQFVASLLKAEGFDGLIYSSLMKVDGFNVALFNPNIAAAKSVDVYQVEDVSYWSKKIDT